MIKLRPFQETLKQDIYAAWRGGAQNVLAVAPTGAGKTVIFSEVLREHDGPSVAIAHRHELVSQISLALARNEVRHRIIGTHALIRNCVSLHIAETGRSYFNPQAHCAAAGVDTLIRMPPTDPWLASVTKWVQDEAHHVTRANKWGKAVGMFTNPRVQGLGVTATPMRGDGHGLGRRADGVMDVLVQAPGMRDIIRMGFLTDYRIFAPPSDLDLSGVTVSAGGDYSPEPLRKAVHASHIVGDVVQHYLRIAPGKLGITFAVDIASATEIAAAYRAAGVPAEVVTGETPIMVRAAIMRRFSNAEIKQLVNVDLFGEGFDLPAIEVVSMARPTHSFALYAQQFGRALRLLAGKAWGIIIDHVGNVARHGLPDAYREYTLDRREKRSRSTVADVMPIRVCPKCTGAYEADQGMTCPYCGHRAEPAGRSTPAQVDGDLYELDPAVLARMRGEIDQPPSLHAAPGIQMSINARHREAAEAQRLLRAAMDAWSVADAAANPITAALWAAGTPDLGRAWRRFYLTFGVTVLEAQALGRADAEALMARITKGK